MVASYLDTDDSSTSFLVNSIEDTDLGCTNPLRRGSAYPISALSVRHQATSANANVHVRFRILIPHRNGRYMCNTNYDTYTYMCAGAQHSSSNRFAARTWIRSPDSQKDW